MHFLLKERSLPLQKQVAFTSFDLRSDGNIEPKIIIVQLLHETGEGHSVKVKPVLYLIKTNKHPLYIFLLSFQRKITHCVALVDLLILAIFSRAMVWHVSVMTIWYNRGRQLSVSCVNLYPHCDIFQCKQTLWNTWHLPKHRVEKPKISINYTWRSTALEKVCEIGKTNFSLAIVQMSAAFFSVGLLVFEKLMSILVHGNWIISILLVNQQTNVVSGFNRACKLNVPDHRHVDYKSKLLWAGC